MPNHSLAQAIALGCTGHCHGGLPGTAGMPRLLADPGVFDIHPPSIVSQEHLAKLIREAAARIRALRLRRNPD